MPILGAVVLLIQFCFAYHALKTGRPWWWIGIIMGFPVFGCILYYFIEVFPNTRESVKAEKAVALDRQVVRPGRVAARARRQPRGLRQRRQPHRARALVHGSQDVRRGRLAVPQLPQRRARSRPGHCAARIRRSAAPRSA